MKYLKLFENWIDDIDGEDDEDFLSGLGLTDRSLITKNRFEQISKLDLVEQDVDDFFVMDEMSSDIEFKYFVIESGESGIPKGIFGTPGDVDAGDAGVLINLDGGLLFFDGSDVVNESLKPVDMDSAGKWIQLNNLTKDLIGNFILLLAGHCGKRWWINGGNALTPEEMDQIQGWIENN
jgi:hypothetical protein